MSLKDDYPHYHKDVEHLKTIDVYRVLERFGVTDPTIQHAVKKLLACGQRGAKDQLQDVQESIASLKRYVEMYHENAREGMTSDLAHELKATIEQRDELAQEVVRLNNALECARYRKTATVTLVKRAVPKGDTKARAKPATSATRRGR